MADKRQIDCIEQDCESGLQYVPEHLREGLRAYVLDGIKPGGFLVACIENDLMTAAVKADPISLACLPAIAKFFYNSTPSPCWGSPYLREAWQSIGGARGWTKARG